LNSFWLLFKIFYSELVSKKGAIFISSFIFILSFLFLLQSFESYYKNHYISSLRYIYPHTFIYHNKLLPSAQLDITHHLEIYAIGIENLQLAYNKDYFHLKSVDIRSFHEKHPPTIIQDQYKNNKSTNTIYVNESLYQKITSHKDYQGFIFINDAQIPVAIDYFTGYADADYILLDNTLAKRIFAQKRFNINNIYSSHKEQYIKRLYESKNIPITLWSDVLPFFNKVFYRIASLSFAVYLFVFVCLSVLFANFILYALIVELKKATSFMINHGKSATTIITLSTLVTSLIYLIIYALSYGIYYFSLQYIASQFDFFKDIMPSYYLGGFLFSNLFIVALVSALVLSQRKKSIF